MAPDHVHTSTCALCSPPPPGPLLLSGWSPATRRGPWRSSLPALPEAQGPGHPANPAPGLGLFVHFFNSFIVIEFTCHQTHPRKGCNSMTSGMQPPPQPTRVLITPESSAHPAAIASRARAAPTLPWSPGFPVLSAAPALPCSSQVTQEVGRSPLGRSALPQPAHCVAGSDSGPQGRAGGAASCWAYPLCHPVTLEVGFRGAA